MAPRWPPDGMLSNKQLQYMKHAVGMGQYLLGLVVNLVHLGKSPPSCHPDRSLMLTTCPCIHRQQYVHNQQQPCSRDNSLGDK